MPAVKVNLTLDPLVAEQMRARAEQLSMPVSRYITDLVTAEVRQHQDRLAAEGYRLLSADSVEFAEAAMPIGAENWPE